MELVVVLQNLRLGGEGRWPQFADRLRPGDLLLLNEAPASNAMLEDFAGLLGMNALPLPPSESGIPPAICYRPEVLGPVSEYNADLSATLTHGVCVACWDIPGLGLLAAAAGHFSPFSPGRAQIDAECTAWTAQRYGEFSLIGADVNGPPLEGPSAEVALMNQRDRALRFLDPLADPPQVPNRANAQALANYGYVDAFTVLYQRTGDPRFQAKTGRSDRIDAIHVSRQMVPAVTGGELLDMSPGDDHRGVLVRVDTDLAGR